MENIIARGIVLAKHADGRETITNNAYLFIDFNNSQITSATSQSYGFTKNDFTKVDDKLIYKFCVKNERGEYEGDASISIEDTTVWSEKVIISTYTTSRGSSGKIFYTEWFKTINDLRSFEKDMNSWVILRALFLENQLKPLSPSPYAAGYQSPYAFAAGYQSPMQSL